MSVCFLSTWKETNGQPVNMENTFNLSSEKFRHAEFSSEFMPDDIATWIGLIEP